MSDGNYSGADKILHQIVFGGRATSNLFFDVESALYGRKLKSPAQGRHVFISGLARAGTTLLLNILHSSDQFASLTYRDMPLVMAPNLWRSMSSKHSEASELRERAHGDGMMVNADSPEALEEVFWRTFSGPKYLRKHALVPMKADTETLKAFRKYVALILRRYDRSRYLSKNNNSILRLPSIARAFPNATILIPFRHPASHAASLLRQHLRFVETHKKDPFSRKYMTWLAHHEFGLDHRRFQFGDNIVGGDPNEIGYWVDLWVEAYSYLLDTHQAISERAVFICYEDVTSDAAGSLARLQEVLELDIDPSISILPAKVPPVLETVDLERALSVYTALRQHPASFDASASGVGT